MDSTYEVESIYPSIDHQIFDNTIKFLIVNFESVMQIANLHVSPRSNKN